VEEDALGMVGSGYTLKKPDLGITVPTTAGLIFLRKWLDPERTGVFRFLDLPAELRNVIYELVLTLPPSGPSIGAQGDMWLREREVDDPDYDSTNYGTVWKHKVRSSPLQELLAIISVNKQMFNEAMPITTRATTSLSSALMHYWISPPGRARRVSSISVRLDWAHRLVIFTGLTQNSILSRFQQQKRRR
jgi:hypothetical protein